MFSLRHMYRNLTILQNMLMFVNVDDPTGPKDNSIDYKCDAYTHSFSPSLKDQTTANFCISNLLVKTFLKGHIISSNAFN